jgi:hypothetical protein
VHKLSRNKTCCCQNFFIFSTDTSNNIAVQTAQLKAGDISRRKKVKEKRPSPFLFIPGKIKYWAFRGKFFLK